MKNHIPFHEQVATKLIEQLKLGTAPWQKPWEAGQKGYLPINPTTGKRYKGINTLQLMSQGRSDNRWLTYQQAISINAQVKKSEIGTSIQFWKFTDDVLKKDPQGNPILDDNGEQIKVKIHLERPKVFFATVFNAEQIEGMPSPEIAKVHDWETHQRAEAILTNSNVTIKHDENDRAFYRLSTDSIHLPSQSQFPTADRYYATALHELGHATGHPSRLNRDLAHPFGSTAYAKEELRAEIGSMILGDELGIGHDGDQHVAYVRSWINTLQDDPMEIFRAAADAEKIHSLVLSYEQQQVLNTQLEIENEMDIDALDNWQNMKSRAEALSIEAILVKNAYALTQHKNDNPLSILDEPDMQQRIKQEEQKESLISPRVFINVPFKEKDQAKALGAKWDRSVQSWYIPDDSQAATFAQWPSKTLDADQPALSHQASTSNQQPTRTYLAVPYKMRETVKTLGAKWDKGAKSWFIPAKAKLNDALKQYLPENVSEQQSPSLTPREEFADALRAAGCEVTGDHPIMDGSKQRVRTDGDKPKETAGFYFAYLDGHPAGFIKNNRTGEEIKWKSKGYAFSPEEKAKMMAESATKLAVREAQNAAQRDSSAKRVSEQQAKLKPIETPTPYQSHKNIAVHPGTYTDDEGQTTFIPAYDTQGKQWTMQYIDADGTKRFAKDSQKEGSFHVIGGQDALITAPAIVISEGYATAATLTENLGYATVAAFDAGNLIHVAKALKAQYPDKPILIAGDDDKHLEMMQGVNPGKDKAEKAAIAVDGHTFFPRFTHDEKSWPDNLEPVTPEKWKAKLISDEQSAALNNIKQYTDFNDLKNLSANGSEMGLRRQINDVIEKKMKLLSKVNHEEIQHNVTQHRVYQR